MQAERAVAGEPDKDRLREGVRAGRRVGAEAVEVDELAGRSGKERGEIGDDATRGTESEPVHAGRAHAVDDADHALDGLALHDLLVFPLIGSLRADAHDVADRERVAGLLDAEEGLDEVAVGEAADLVTDPSRVGPEEGGRRSGAKDRLARVAQTEKEAIGSNLPNPLAVGSDGVEAINILNNNGRVQVGGGGYGHDADGAAVGNVGKPIPHGDVQAVVGEWLARQVRPVRLRGHVHRHRPTIRRTNPWPPVVFVPKRGEVPCRNLRWQKARRKKHLSIPFTP